VRFGDGNYSIISLAVANNAPSCRESDPLPVYLDRQPLSGPSRPSESLHTTQVYLSRNTLVGVLRLSIDSYNALWRDGVATIGQLAQMSSEQILSVRNVGGKSLAEICVMV
jgi:hypothetical protein